jgi:hypothetical protein
MRSRFYRLLTAAAALAAISLPLFSSISLAQTSTRCAQPLSSGDKPVATDCLFLLNVAVGTQTCSLACACAPTGTLPTKATDALLCLASATGQSVVLNCPCLPLCAVADCDGIRTACEAEVDTVESETIASCPSTAGSERTACLERATKIAQAGEGVCDDFHADCASCCQSNGENCLLAPEVPKVIGTFEIPEREMLENPPDLPPGPGGIGFMLLPLPDGEVGFDPLKRTPATAAAECAGAVLSCFSAGERNWAGCLTAVPTCTSNTPWQQDGPACCTPSCLPRYQELRREGRTNPAAFTGAIYEGKSCMPGLDAFTGREAVE